jgi:hypothetical protein
LTFLPLWDSQRFYLVLKKHILKPLFYVYSLFKNVTPLLPSWKKFWFFLALFLETRILYKGMGSGSTADQKWIQKVFPVS